MSYLYFKETKSSFAIEREEPGANKAERFVALLHQAGTEASRALKKSLPEEIRFLERLSTARRRVSEIVDMPDRLLDSLLMRLHRNNGTLAKQRREGEFKMLTDGEIARIQQAFREAFEMDVAGNPSALSETQ